jgi:hypothetical protein
VAIIRHTGDGVRYASSELIGQPAHPPQTKFSDDGFWWWDGAEWKPAVSPDRLWRWTGQTWVPAQQAAAAPAAAGHGAGMAVLVTVGVFVGVLVVVSILVLVILLTMGGQIQNVFQNVVAALGP